MKKAKKTVKAAKLKPLVKGETVTLPCNAEITVRNIYKNLNTIAFSTETYMYTDGPTKLIMVAKQSIDPLITILRRAKLSLRK